ncbi:MAG: type II toxin-antitoxin system RelE/ParE family toxin [Ruminococcus sp.]|nr:type II toxin-antitoxin system RelE/ParE family toxin [Ruminococcus sp.]
MSTDNKILFTLKAQEDLNGIFDYIYNNLYSPQAARRIMRLIDDSINRLADFPMSCPLIDDFCLAQKGYRKLVADKYIVIYKFREEKSEVIIHRIINGKVDYLPLLSGQV